MSYRLTIRDYAFLSVFASHPSVTPIEENKWVSLDFPGYVEQFYNIDGLSYLIQSVDDAITGIVVYGDGHELEVLAALIEHSGGRLFDGKYRIRPDEVVC